MAKVRIVRSTAPKLTEQDLIDLRSALVSIASMKVSLEHIQSTSDDNHKTLRGHNGTPGLVARFGFLEDQIKDVDAKVGQTVDTLKSIQVIGDKLDAMAQYPSLTWLIRHKPREMVLITFGVVFLVFFIAFPEYAGLLEVAERALERWLSP